MMSISRVLRSNFSSAVGVGCVFFIVNHLSNNTALAFSPSGTIRLRQLGVQANTENQIQSKNGVSCRFVNARLIAKYEPSATLIPSLTGRRRATSLKALAPDLDIVSLVVGQENYGLAIVSLGEGIWSFLSGSPSLSSAIRTVLPTAIAAIVLVALSGPMIIGPSVDVTSIGTGLWIATFVSIGLGANYVLRLLASYSDSPKENAALGLLVAIAGFFSFGQNLIVGGFVSLPSLPSLPPLELPSLF